MRGILSHPRSALAVALLLLALPLAPLGAATVVYSPDPTTVMTPRMNLTWERNTQLGNDLVNLTLPTDPVQAALDIARSAIAARLSDLDPEDEVAQNLTVGLGRAQANLDSARRVLDLAASQPVGRALALDVAAEAVSSRRAILAPEASARTLGYFDQAARNVDALRALPGGSGLERAVQLAKDATARQAAALGVTVPATSFTPFHALPSGALRAYLADNGIAPTPEEDARLQAFDGLAEPARARLAAAVEAYARFESATEAAFAAGDAAKLHAYLTGTAVEPTEEEIALADEAPALRWNRLAAAGVDVGPILAARGHLLAASLDLRDALAALPLPQACDTVALGRAELPFEPFSIDLTACPNTYARPVALLIDVAGADTYLNNAGGNRLVGSCEERDPLGDPRAPAAAALLDFGGRDVRAGPPCGVNGGAALGAGLLIDDGDDDDRYGISGEEVISGGRVADGEGANGGGHVGLGLLLDAGGSDAYDAGEYGVNGGGFIGFGVLIDQGGARDWYNGTFGGVNGAGDNGAGWLHDDGGDDRYRARAMSANGGGHHGVGVLIDEWGNDRYNASVGTTENDYNSTTNGAGRLGVGFLFDGGGDDYYHGDRDGVNGGGWDGLGTLVDVDGWDTYLATDNGTNGAGWGIQFTHSHGGTNADVPPRFGVGILVDLAGRDGYHGGKFSVNGGCYISASFLYDGGGNDWYTARDGGGANGGAGGHSKAACVAFLLDRAGDDTYEVGTTPDFVGKGSNGGGANIGGVGFLFDASGHDTYRAHNVGVNGGGFMAVGMLLDASGDDKYYAGARGVNGGAYGGNQPGGFSDQAVNPASPGGLGFLIDVEGNDRYEGKDRGVNGGGFMATGFLYDGQGGDTYKAWGNGTNGGGAGGTGLLFDRLGNDWYEASKPAANGGAANATGVVFVPAGVGLLLDGAGVDTYQDAEGGTGVDKCVFPKGDAGAGHQRDLGGLSAC